MRTDAEMLDLILAAARADERIRAVILNGSRANPNARRDPFQDFDIVYLVTQVEPFKQSRDWLLPFGPIMILQTPDEMGAEPPGGRTRYAYLTLFSDGHRIDFTFHPLERLDALLDDSLSVLLLDKDGAVPPFAPASESGCLPIPPSAKAFGDCCNEFWWVSTYVAKGLWRGEITYAKYFMDQTVRAELMKMLTWLIGVQTGFARNPGKSGKHFAEYLPPEMWQLLLSTYCDADEERNWQALFALGELFRRSARIVAEQFHFDYPQGDDERVSAHLRRVHVLPRDAKEIR